MNQDGVSNCNASSDKIDSMMHSQIRSLISSTFAMLKDCNATCSGIHKYTGCLPACSPNGRYIASAEEYRLTIRELENLQVVQLYSCLDRIRTIEWCSRSEYLVCGLQNRAIVQVCNLIRSFGACCDHSHHESYLGSGRKLVTIWVS